LHTLPDLPNGAQKPPGHAAGTAHFLRNFSTRRRLALRAAFECPPASPTAQFMPICTMPLHNRFGLGYTDRFAIA
jgi:hypothetical protein